jgi:hypothetical protein
MSSKAEWITYATNIAGEWALCANCQPDSSGKKLYRQYNYWRQIMSIARADSPIDNTEYATDGYLEFWYIDPDGVNPQNVYIFDTYEIGQDFICANIGLSTANPIWEYDSSVTNTHLYSGPAFDFVQKVVTTLGQDPGVGGEYPFGCNCCLFTANGAPGNNRSFPFAWIGSDA